MSFRETRATVHTIVMTKWMYLWWVYWIIKWQYISGKQPYRAFSPFEYIFKRQKKRIEEIPMIKIDLINHLSAKTSSQLRIRHAMYYKLKEESDLT